MTQLKDYLAYDETSQTCLRWIKKASSRAMPGMEAMTNIATGRRYQGGFKGSKLFAHRVVWFLHNGTWPDIIDHINGNQLDNRINNLREATTSINNHNRVSRGTHRSGRMRGYSARIGINGKSVYLGTYQTEEAAHAAYLEAKQKLHPTAPRRCYG